MPRHPTPFSSAHEASAALLPSFLVKSAFGCSVVVLILLVPFTINNFLQGRIVMGLATSSIGVAACFNILEGLRGRYSVWVNTWLIAPTGAFTITYTLVVLGPVGSYWPVLLTLSYYFVLPERRAWVLNGLTLLLIIPAAWYALDPSAATRFTAALLGVSLFAFIAMRQIYALSRLLRERAVTDALTGLLNRSLLEDGLRRAIAQNDRSRIPMTVLTLDIDHFKSINDALGHEAGDRVLRGVARILRDRTRGGDRTFRIGGEEFLILMHDADESAGRILAETLRRAVEEAGLLPRRSVTVSVGVSQLAPGMTPAEWARESDEKLYRAKQSGRNRVVA